ncbi:MAG: universal stress protein, partial [Verrucomicrobiota bacterium]
RPPSFSCSPPSASRREILSGLEEKLMREVDAFKNEASGLAIKPVVVDSFSGGKGIVDYLNRSNADLAVVGTRGRTGLKRLLLGTAAEKVIHGSPCAVLSVKPADYKYEQ